LAAKIDVKIAVDDSAFAAYARKFQAYTDQLNKTPDAWKKVSRSSEESLVHFEMIAAALTDQAAMMTTIVSGSTTLRRESETTDRHWRSLANTTRNVAHNIGEATAALLKWSGVTAVVGGLMAGIGAMGFDSLANNVSSNRTASMGVGATYGARSSFMVNFRRLTDPEGFLNRVNEISHRADNVPLRSLGLTQEQTQGDSADVGANAILKLKELVDSVKDPRFLQDTLHARRADELISINQAEMLKSMSPAEVRELVANYRKDKSKLSLSDDTQKKWQDFSTHLSAAGKKIENTFVRNLGAITPGLSKLAESFAGLVDVLMKNDGPLAHWIEKFDEGIEWLAKNVDTPEFQHKVENFIDGFAKAAVAVGKFLGGLVSLAESMGISTAQAAEAPVGGRSGGLTGLRPGGGSPGGPGGGGSGSFTDALADIESTNRNIFSTVDHDKYGPGTRSQGYFQIDTGTWRDFAPKDVLAKYPNAMSAPRDIQEQVARLIPLSRFGGRTKRMMLQRFGPLDFRFPVGKLADGHGGSNEKRSSGMSYRTQNHTTKVSITKPTGGDPNVAAAAAANP